MESGSKRPDSPAVAHAAVRAAVTEAGRCCDGLPLVAGGKSFGGRMTSQAQALSPLPGVRGLAFLGFPLHPAGKPSSDRAKHLADIRIPMLFRAGNARCARGIEPARTCRQRVGARSATLHPVDEADHSFHVLKRSGRNDREVMDEVLDAFAAWVDGDCGLTRDFSRRAGCHRSCRAAAACRSASDRGSTPCVACIRRLAGGSG